MDEYERSRYRTQLLTGLSGALVKMIAAGGALAVFAASVVQLAHAW